MAKRRYTGVSVSSHICCSSSHDYFATVELLGQTGTFGTCQYLISAQVIVAGDNDIDRPKYLIEMIRAALRAQADQLRIYEHDRDGNRRYESLRYGSMEDLLGYVAR